MPVVRQFFTNFEAADEVAAKADEKAFLKFDEAMCFLAGFALDKQGMTPEQVKSLAEKLEAFHDLNSEYSRAEMEKESLVFRLQETLRLQNSASQKVIPQLTGISN